MSIEAERAEFVAEALRSAGCLRLRVHGESMLPVLWPGATVEVSPCSIEDLRTGEIVLAFRDGRLFLHRLIHSPNLGLGAGNNFILRGDSMPKADPAYPREALLGRVVSSAESHPSFVRMALVRAAGLVFCYSGIARRLALKLHKHVNRGTAKFLTQDAS